MKAVSPGAIVGMVISIRDGELAGAQALVAVANWLGVAVWGVPKFLIRYEYGPAKYNCWVLSKLGVLFTVPNCTFTLVAA